jgi:cell division protein FtsL
MAWQLPPSREERAAAVPAREVLVKVLTKHPVIAADAESAVNPRARSAKLRAAVRVGKGGRMDKAGTFEYEIRKDFRNNQIVREVDERRQRDLWQSLGIGIVLVGVLLFSAWQHFELLRHGYRLEQMQKDRAAESDINRHLRLEMETLRAPQRIEKLATERLGMVAPKDGESVVLERVAPTDPPAKSVVASR